MSSFTNVYFINLISVAPVCRPGQPKVYGVARGELAKIPCELEANPTDVQFLWKFNNSADIIDIPQNQVSVDRARSIVGYKPFTEMDYGTLLCWGSNEIGIQKEPCVYYVNPAGEYKCCSFKCFRFLSCCITSKVASKLKSNGLRLLNT